MAPKVFICTECKLSIKVHIFIWGGLRGGTRLFCHPGRTATAAGSGQRRIWRQQMRLYALCQELFVLAVCSDAPRGQPVVNVVTLADA